MKYMSHLAQKGIVHVCYSSGTQSIHMIVLYATHDGLTLRLCVTRRSICVVNVDGADGRRQGRECPAWWARTPLFTHDLIDVATNSCPQMYSATFLLFNVS